MENISSIFKLCFLESDTWKISVWLYAVGMRTGKHYAYPTCKS